MSITLNMAAVLLKSHQIRNIYREMPNYAYNPHMANMSKILICTDEKNGLNAAFHRYTAIILTGGPIYYCSQTAKD